MPDGENVVLVVEYNPKTRQVTMTVPQDSILALGMLRYVEEAVLVRAVRPQMLPAVTLAPPGVVMPKNRD